MIVELYDATQGTRLPRLAAMELWEYSQDRLRASVDGSVFCGYGDDLLACYDLFYTGSNSRPLIFSLRGARSYFGSEGTPTDMGLAEDGSRVYVSLFQRFRAYDTRTMSTLPDRGGNIYGDSGMAVGLEGRLYGTAHTWEGPQDVWVLDDERRRSQLVPAWRPRANSLGTLACTGDGKRFRDAHRPADDGVPLRAVTLPARRSLKGERALARPPQRFEGKRQRGSHRRSSWPVSCFSAPDARQSARRRSRTGTIASARRRGASGYLLSSDASAAARPRRTNH